ncbi:hypothetical protein GCM10011390_30510 [Aureimonas endophytica]|uniref:Phage integrase central domain-containing protein n=2 Tax=Aureimonas endophytica TaxID=2027858 RepID=A0A916ZQP6_9HYPH|nr:hypothetical protein GCM10011390_30510 [Aureimonas endophytica]
MARGTGKLTDTGIKSNPLKTGRHSDGGGLHVIILAEREAPGAVEEDAGGYANPIREKRVSSIDANDVLKVLNPIWAKKAETASRLRGRIENVLDFAKAKGWRTGIEPGALARPSQERPAGSPEACARPSRGDALRSTRMKAAKEHRVPLCNRAVEILRELHEVRTGNLVFPSMHRDKAASGKAAEKPRSVMAMDMLLRRMKQNVTVHGFRSAFRDWAGEETSFPREVAEQALAHHVGDAVERAYRRGDALEKRRQLMETWATYLAMSEEGETVQLRMD